MLNRLATIAIVLLVTACSLPLLPRNGTRLAFQLTIPTMTATGDSRLVVGETTSVQVTVSGEDEDQILTFLPTLDSTSGTTKASIVVPLEPGDYDFVVETLDSEQRVLTAGEMSLTIVVGTNQASLTLLPVDVLTHGSTWPLETDQVAYFRLAASVTDTLLTGNDSTFWVLEPNGTYTGTGTAGSLSLVASETERIVRVDQGADGSFDVIFSDPISTIVIDFTLPEDPVILGANNLVLNATKGDQPTVNLAGTSFTSYVWYIDGATTYPSSDAFTLVGDALVIDSTQLTNGSHEVMVVVTDSTGAYSARFLVEVVR